MMRRQKSNGADRARTGNPHVANVVLSQLSYGPEWIKGGDKITAGTAVCKRLFPLT